MRSIPILVLLAIICPALLYCVWYKKVAPSPDNSRPVVDGSKATSPDDSPAADLGEVADFSLTERSGKTITLDDLRGKVWVASFLFTRCKTGCPRISADLLQLQKNLAGTEGVLIVSFTVDPEHDTPAVLKAYADSLGADPKRWLFLTGKQEEIYRLIRDSFHLGVEQNQGRARTQGNEVTHSNRLIVVDREGHIRGVDFDGTNPDDLPRLKRRIEELVQSRDR
jgi:cytochrome oxidase Cu insertion factor (SCO1/SenC/PrrC family)